jgi:eukaryotic-like serine/threonine-protein kinase
MLHTPSSNDSHRDGPIRRRRLDAWKEIAAYLKRDVTTVRRWERREGLPVHRHLHDKLGSVFAYEDEIDAWSHQRSRRLDPSDRLESAANTEEASYSFSTRGFAVVITAAVIALTSGRVGAPDAGPRPDASVRVAIVTPEVARVNSLALSPDGDNVAFAAPDAAGNNQLWVRRIDSGVSQLLPGTNGATFPFWSPDGRALGFFAEGKLKRIALSTREARDLAAASDGRGGTWNDRDVIVFAPDYGGPLFRVAASGGPAVAVTSIGSSPVEGHAWPEFLPDGRHFLYTDYCDDRNRYGIYVGDLETGVTKRLLAVYSSAAYSTYGFLLYAVDALVAQPFDLDRLEPRGDPVPVADRPMQHYGLGHKVDFSVSRSGLLAARTATDEQTRLIWFDRMGRVLGEVGDAALYSNPALSPSGRELVVTVGQGDRGPANLWLFDLAHGASSRLTFAKGANFAPVWSPAADRIIFASSRSRKMELYQRNLDGGGSDTKVLDAPMMQIPEAWSADGRHLTFSTMQPGTKSDVWAWQLDDDRSPVPVLQGPSNEGQSQISPDGRFIAYISDESGRFEVYVQPFPLTQEKWQISAGGGFDPRWRRDGRELFYIGADRKLMAVDVRTRGVFQHGAANSLFDTSLIDLWQDTRNHYEVAPDGRRFLIMVPRVDPRSVPFTMLLNWQQGRRDVRPASRADY